MTDTTSKPNDLDWLLNNLRQQLSDATSNAEYQKRQGEAIKKLQSDLAKVSDLHAKQKAGRQTLSTGVKSYEMLRDYLTQDKNFDKYDLLSQIVIQVDHEIEKLRQAWVTAQQQKPGFDLAYNKAKLDEADKLAALDSAKLKLSNLPKAIQDRIADVDKQPQAVNDALEADDLDGAGIAITTLKEILDGFKKDDGTTEMQPGYESLDWLTDEKTETQLITAIHNGLDEYFNAVKATGQAANEANTAAETVINSEKSYKAALAQRLAEINAKYEKALAESQPTASTPPPGTVPATTTQPSNEPATTLPLSNEPSPPAAPEGPEKTNCSGHI